MDATPFPAVRFCHGRSTTVSDAFVPVRTRTPWFRHHGPYVRAGEERVRRGIRRRGPKYLKPLEEKCAEPCAPGQPSEPQHSAKCRTERPSERLASSPRERPVTTVTPNSPKSRARSHPETTPASAYGPTAR